MIKKIDKKRLIDALVVLFCLLIPIIRYWENISQDLLMVNGDGMNIFTPTFFQANQTIKGDVPLWNSYVITGMPFFADPNNSFFYPFHLLALVLSPTLYSNLYYVIHVALAGIFTYLFLKKSSNSFLAALSGALMIVFSVFIGGYRREHVAVYTSVVWLPLILYFVLCYLQTKERRFLLFSAMAMALQFFGGHPQYTFYSDLVVFTFLAYNMMLNKQSIKEVITSLIMLAVFFILFSAIFLLPLMELVGQSSRFKTSYFTLLSTRWELLLMTAFPYVFGDIYQPLGEYASAEISIEIYLGIIPLIYAIYAVRYYFSERLIKFGVFAIVIAWLYSSWSNIPYVGGWLQLIPILNFFDVQSRILYIYVFFGIFCFAIGFKDIRNLGKLKSLLDHNAIMAFLLTLIALVIAAFRLSPTINNNDVVERYSIISNVWLRSLFIAYLNLLLVGILYKVKNKMIAHYLSFIFVFTLLGVSFIDVGRLSVLHNTVSYDTLVFTEETNKVKELLGEDPYRIVTVYDSHYGSSYGDISGLRDNWSMNNNIRNLKGRTEFENLALNELLAQSESRDNTNIRNLLSDGAILSMLSIKYVLIPNGEQAPYNIPSQVEKEILNVAGPISTSGDGELSVISFSIPFETERYYKVELDVSASKKDIQYLYIDFYGAGYDFAAQDKVLDVKNGAHSYSVIIFTGDKPVNKDKIDFRIISSSYSPIQVSNLKIAKLAAPVLNTDYLSVAQTSNYTIYENLRAQKMLYIPERVVNIKDSSDLTTYPYNYPDMDRTSYVEGVKSFRPGGELTILSVGNDSVSGRIISTDYTFVNHTQSYYPGWKAFIDGTPTSIHLVNGVIQGVEVPPGDHIVKFSYEPLSLRIGGAISILTFIFAIVFTYLEIRKQQNIR